jgi:1-acyl-sn-glycerol-3-phosphate acyltransferase
MDYLRGAFFLFVIRPLLFLTMGAHVWGRDLVPEKGPAIIVANHNSHLDTLTILAMFPMRVLSRVRPVAAADYFMKSPLMAWFALNIIGIIPIKRGGGGRGNPLQACEEALDRGDILILFPEGSRGQPEILSEFKRGVAHLVRNKPGVPVHPLFIYGLGKSLPKGSFIFVPFNCLVVAGEAFQWTGEIGSFMDVLQTRMSGLAHRIQMPPWD